MSEDCQKCGTGIYEISELDEERNCPGCSDTGNTYNWEEQDYSENRLVYEWDGHMQLCDLDELPKRDRQRRTGPLPSWLKLISDKPPCEVCGVVMGGCLAPRKCPKLNRDEKK